MEWNWVDIAGVAIVVPTVSLAAVFIVRVSARWIMHAVENSFGAVVLAVMAPDMAHIGTKIAGSLDELREANTRDHRKTADRLSAVEDRETDVETRLAAVERKLNIRPPDLRTRIGDPDGAHHNG